MREEVVRFVTWDRVEGYLVLGWLPVGHGYPYHDKFGCICIWRCQCRCVEPVR